MKRRSFKSGAKRKVLGKKKVSRPLRLNNKSLLRLEEKAKARHEQRVPSPAVIPDEMLNGYQGLSKAAADLLLQAGKGNISLKKPTRSINQILFDNVFTFFNFINTALAVVKMAIMGNPLFDIELREIRQGGKSYTYQTMRDLVEQHPDSAVAYAARAGIEKERGMGDLAVYDFKEAIKRDPDNSDYHISYVDLLITLKRKGEALDELDKLVKMGVHRGSLFDLYSRARKIK